MHREAIKVSCKGEPHGGQDAVKTLRTIIWYKRACIRQTTRQPSLTLSSQTYSDLQGWGPIVWNQNTQFAHFARCFCTPLESR